MTRREGGSGSELRCSCKDPEYTRCKCASCTSCQYGLRALHLHLDTAGLSCIEDAAALRCGAFVASSALFALSALWSFKIDPPESDFETNLPCLCLPELKLFENRP